MRPSSATITVVGLVLGSAITAAAQGIFLPGAGPINRAMAGASTAAPVDFGSTYWNPANLSGLERPEFLLGSELAIPSIHLTTFVPQGAFDGVNPTRNRYGVARSDSGVAGGLAAGVAFRLEDDSPVTFGLGVFGLGGGNFNFAGSETTPLLLPLNPPESFGVGPIWANAAILAMEPAVSVRLTERLSVGGGPVVTSGSIGFDPAFFAPEQIPNSNLPTFPSGTNSRTFWGAGFQLGILLEANDNWNIGFSYKSPIWQERWAFNSEFLDGTARRIGVQAQLPAIYSWGLAYKGIERTLVDVDLRYIDYANATLFGQSVPDGGLGWNSVFAVAVGGKHDLTDRLTLLGGYLYNTQPIPNTATLFNVQLPGIVTNTMSLGSSLKLTDNITMTLAWVHGFREDIQGGVVQLPRSTVKIDAQLDSIVTGINVQFGGNQRVEEPPQLAGLD